MTTPIRRGLLIAAITLLPAVPGGGAPRSESMETRVLISAAKPIVLGAAPTRIALAPVVRGETVASRAASLRPGRRLYLLIRGLRVDTEPGVIYHVYLNLPAGAKPADYDPRHVGIINFYGVPAGSSPDRVFQSFDITDAVRTLRAKGLLGNGTTVTFHPAGQAASGAKASVVRVEVVEE
jgi:tyrosinase